MTPYSEQSSKEGKLHICQQKMLRFLEVFRFKSLSRFFNSEAWTIDLVSSLASLIGVITLVFISQDINNLKNEVKNLIKDIDVIKEKQNSNKNTNQNPSDPPDSPASLGKPP
ncbi:MAG: hypothetical protein OXF67_05135 [Cyanobacteria bacterium MAG CAR4_bin_6]|nr:hypothetical protein [Cyanobacteria bacterium MAG CAR4_bin_6]